MTSINILSGKYTIIPCHIFILRDEAQCFNPVFLSSSFQKEKCVGVSAYSFTSFAGGWGIKCRPGQRGGGGV